MVVSGVADSHTVGIKHLKAFMDFHSRVTFPDIQYMMPSGRRNSFILRFTNRREMLKALKICHGNGGCPLLNAGPVAAVGAPPVDPHELATLPPPPPAVRTGGKEYTCYGGSSGDSRIRAVCSEGPSPLLLVQSALEMLA